MTPSRSGIEVDVLAWLAETGVENAGAETKISSLNLAWIVHRYEEAHTVAVEIADEELARINDVQSLVDALSSVAERTS